MRNNKITISFDESTKSTGYAVFEGKKLINYGAIQENSKNVNERVLDILNQVEELITGTYSPETVVVENVQITMSAPTAKALMGLQFAIELLCYKYNIECVLVRSAHWRKVLGLSNSPKIKRTEKKQQAMDYVKNKYGIDEKIDDVTDAICIGESYIKENELNERP